MKSNSYISIKEKRLLMLLTLLIFTFTIINLGLIVYEDSFRDSAIDFSSCGTLRANFIPHFRLFSLLIFVLLFLETRIVFSFLSTFLAFIAFTYENAQCIFRFIEEDWHLSFLEMLNLIARPLDYVVFLLISILLFWQILILIRNCIQIFKDKNGLK